MSLSDNNKSISGSSVQAVKTTAGGVTDWREVASRGADGATSRPNSQVVQRAPRRKFSTSDRLRIVNAADACTQPGEIGALLRREGLYSSTLSGFRKQRDAGKFGKPEADPAKVRSHHLEKEATRQRDLRKIAALELENKKLKILLDLQKKVAELMDLPLGLSPESALTCGIDG